MGLNFHTKVDVFTKSVSGIFKGLYNFLKLIYADKVEEVRK